jgi:hypothetical protein
MVGCLSWRCRRALTLSLGGEAFALHLFRAVQTERVRLPGNASGELLLTEVSHYAFRKHHFQSFTDRRNPLVSCH